MSLASAMRSAVASHVGVLQPALVSDSEVEIETYEQVREVFGTNAEIAEAAGYGAPGQYAKGSPEWRRRRTFMRNLQRYEQGRTGGTGQSRRPSRMLPQLVTVARINQTRANTPRTTSDVIRLMGTKGTTSTRVEVTFRYSSPKNPQRTRVVTVVIYTRPSVYRSVGWPMRGRVPRNDDEWEQLGQQFLTAWCIAYGIGAGEMSEGGTDDTPIFLFTIGRDEEQDIVYDFE